MDDKKLIEGLMQKDENALNSLIEVYGNLIYRASYKILNNKELSEECLNLTLLKIWEGIDKFKGDENLFKNWIFTVSKRTAIDIQRKEKNYTNNKIELIENIHSSNNIDEEILLKEEINELGKNIGKLSDKDKKILEDRYYKEKQVKEIAKDLKITPKACSLRLSRILNKIKISYLRGR
ncbi:MAG: RNA polymerase sigma factor [Romboutsia sp.]|uniref:RNA polymerase sigma factor n=1 Tax=Romboutsia sp. TaxID=1965302 RepID=UPI003F339C93